MVDWLKDKIKQGTDAGEPDRVVFYLWPRAGGATFSFSLKPRFPMKAQSSESILFAYYTPQVRASVPPVRFLLQ